MKRTEKWLRVEVMACANCGTLTVVLGNEHGGMRLSGHKCSGAWNHVSSFDAPVAALKADFAEATRIYSFTRPKPKKGAK